MHPGILDVGLGLLDDGQPEAETGAFHLVFLVGQVLKELERFRFGALGQQPAVDATEDIFRIALASRNCWEGDEVKAFADAFAGSRVLGVHVDDVVGDREKSALAVAEQADRLVKTGIHKAGLEGVELDETLKFLADADKVLVVETAVFAAIGRVDAVLTSDAQRERAVEEGDRPLVLAADDDRCDAGLLERRAGVEKIVPSLDRLGIDAGLFQESPLYQMRMFEAYIGTP